MKKFLKSTVPMILVVLLVMMMIVPAFAGKPVKPPKPDDSTNSIVTLESAIPSVVVSGETFEFVLKAAVKDGNQDNWSVSETDSTVIPKSSVVKKTTIMTTFTYINSTANLDEITISYNGTKQGSIDLVFEVESAEINNAPVLNESSYNIDVVEDTTTLLDISASDEDVESLVYSVEGELNFGSIDINGSNINYIPTPNLNGTDSFIITVADVMDQIDSATVTVTVTPVNDAPYFEESMYHFTVEQESFVLIDVTAVDVDLTDQLTYSADVTSLQGSLETTNYPFEYHPPTGFAGIDSFDLTATDLSGFDASAKVSVLVTEKNVAPEFINDPYNITIDEDTTGSITLEAYDGNGSDTLVFSLDSTTTSGTATINGDIITYTPNENSIESVTLDVSVTDGSLTDTTEVTFIVNPVNDAPIIEGNYDFTVENDNTHSFNIIAKDVDFDPLTYILEDHDRAVIEGTTVIYTPDSSLSSDTIQIAVSDGIITTTMYVYVTITDGEIIYVALGDSIPSGVSGSGFVATNYTEKISDLLGTVENETYVNRSVSGFNAIDVYDILNGRYNTEYNETGMLHDVESWIINADVITLCIGANDIMDAVPRTGFLGSLDKYDIQWQTADAGLENFETYWHQIINRIEELNPDVTLITMTIYNPYRTTDSYYELVDPYFTSADQSKYGINHIIKETKNLYSQELEADFDYRFVDIYTEFNNHSNKDSLTGFYNKIFGIDVCDPHPNQAGHDFIYLNHELILQ
ncbi:MAG: hypothetical protein JEZ08_12190 [Clostridiales bacterium]|nr:hypothetical protein [Clostridiales bacterium]